MAVLHRLQLNFALSAFSWTIYENIDVVVAVGILSSKLPPINGIVQICHFHSPYRLEKD